jgi:1,4-dihydroxy-2-naphthoate octaprenyltransferase
MGISLLFDSVMVLIFGVSLVLGILYDLPPANLKNRPWGGTAACFAGHGVLTFLVGWHAAHFSQDLSFDLARLVSLDGSVLLRGIPASLAAGFANAAVFVTTTIPDAPGDKATGKKTFCVAYGEKLTAVAAVVFCTAAAVSVWFLEYHAWVMALPTLISLGTFVRLAIVTNKRAAFQAFKWPVFLLTALVALYVPLYGVLVVCTFFGSKLYYRYRFGIDYPSFSSC